jgi:hypothetical protein
LGTKSKAIYGLYGTYFGVCTSGSHRGGGYLRNT